MKIIKPGRAQVGQAFERECTGKGNGNGNGGCGAVLLVERADLSTTSSSHMGEVDIFETFECAACGTLTDVGEYRGGVLPTRAEWLRAKGKTP